MSDAHALGDILSGRLESLERSDQVRAYRAWHEAAGEQVDAVTTPGRLDDGVLVVECESGVWASELTYLEPQLLERLRAADPQSPVRRLRFMARPTRR